MTAAERYRLARYWYQRGECPGCGAPLTRVAGQGRCHYLPGQPIAIGGRSTRESTLGEVVGNGAINMADPRVCRCTADELAALVHIGSGLVASAGVSPVGSSV